MSDTSSTTSEAPGGVTITTNAPANPQGSNTNDGFIVGVEPGARPGPMGQPAPQPTAQPAQAPQTNGQRMFSVEEVEAIRTEEKTKLYGRIESMDEELKRIRAEREAEQAARAAEEAAAEEAARRKTEEEMDTRQLLEQTRAEMAAEMAGLRNQAEMAQAMLEKERELQQLEEYRRGVLTANSDKIVPQIADFVRGDTPEQIDASVADAIARSESLIQDVTAARAAAFQGMQGTRVTAPPASGPLEEQQEQRQMSAEDIKNMSPSEFAAARGALLEAGRQQFYGNRR